MLWTLCDLDLLFSTGECYRPPWFSCFNFSEKTNLDISCKLSAKQIWSDLENIRRMFLLSIRAKNFDEKHSQIKAYTTRKSLIFHLLCTLFEQIPLGINREIDHKIFSTIILFLPLIQEGQLVVMTGPQHKQTKISSCFLVKIRKISPIFRLLN